MNNPMTSDDPVAVRTEEIEVRYQSHWCQSPVYLNIRGEAVKPEWHPSLFAAVLLGEVEEACALLESVLESDLDFAEYVFLPCDTPDLSQYVRATLPLESGKELIIRAELEICLPLSAVVDKDRAELAKAGFKWAPVEGTLRIGNIELSADDKKRLTENSLLLVPESFRPVWRCAVELSGIDSVVNAEVDVSKQSIDSENSFCAVTDKQFLQIYVADKIAFDPTALINRAGSAKLCDFDLFHADRCQCVCADGRQFDARLVSIGDGFAVSVGERLNGTH